jgi:hypothetical protein
MACAQKSKIDVTLSDTYLGLICTVIGLASVHIILNVIRMVGYLKSKKVEEGNKPGPNWDLGYAVTSMVVIFFIIATCSALIHESSQETVANS